MNPTQTTWPKPSAFPICSFVLFVINVVLYYALAHSGSALWWGVPCFIMNGFFLWAERDIYIREKRNYDDWNKEIEAFYKIPLKELWAQRLMSVDRRKTYQR